MVKKQIKGWANFEGKLMKVYAKEIECKKQGKKKSFMGVTVSVGRIIDDEWVNVYYEVIFAKDCGLAAADLEEGENTIICSGFLSCSVYAGKDGKKVVKPAVVLTKATLDEVEF